MCGENNMRTLAENKVIIYLIRHGLTQGNKEARYIGRTDEPLSSEGALCIENIRENRHKGIVFDYVFSSPMKRCLETARILTGKSEADITVIEDFRETDFGDFEGKNYLELNGNSDYQRWIDSNGTLPFPGGEKLEDFKKRTLEGFSDMMETIELSARNQSMDKGEEITVAAIVHGGTIMAVLENFFGGEYYSYQVKNAQGYVFMAEKNSENVWQFSNLRRC